ncbi:PilN domain-containing protein [Methylocystis parvus]|uniref:PilN domain-containing protein n=1 Tax=Methylocystis parvus TaxID=134 RepID=A0A6B8M1C1_9HYPH|nr:PilN domain-containing protein [Methylocystis parvus]QGM96085.1 PilN domain-containing protein [Methylocystis parvus]WBK00091.1 PilN domain-containing protein [Methylocystis parvus OBBP]
MSSEFWTRDVIEGSLKTATERFAVWYRREFFSLFSSKTVAWLTDRGDRQLILRAGERELRCVNGQGAPQWSLSADEIAASSLDEALARRGVARHAAKVGLDIDGAAFFVRRFDIPAVALNNLPKLLAADIERKTPFRLADVVYGHTSSKHPASPDKLRVSLWILRRDYIDGAIANAGVDVSDISFIRPINLRAAAEEAPLIALEGAAETSYKFRNLALGLCAATAVFGAIGVGATLWRQSALNEELDAKIQEASARAARVRQIVDRASSESRLLSVLRNARRNAPQFADLWEETARILPDGAFVTDFRLSEPKANEKTLDIIGFADSAVGLPALFNKSPLFADAGLTAPITPDPREKREGFSLQAKLEQKKPADAK